ncbi:protein kinase [Achlya hypogyna]|uniref:Protein kinase n=1 Tax=Achlya hypogyna TaxID=1202772 RepID=A0A1V9YNC1_ACHHY|nr:protein kinase [Achlya hypogyna]
MRAMVSTALLAGLASACKYTLSANASLLAADTLCLAARSAVCAVTPVAKVGADTCNVTKTFLDAQTTFVDMTMVGDVRSYMAPTLTLQGDSKTTMDLGAMMLSPSIRTLAFQGYDVISSWPALPTTLTTLKIQQGGLASIPSTIGSSSLTSMDLSGSKLALLDSGSLPSSLTSLNLAGNQLTRLAAFDMVHLTTLTLDKNPLTTIENLRLSSSVSSFSCEQCALSSFSMDRSTYDALTKLSAPTGFTFAAPQCDGNVESLWGMSACVHGSKPLKTSVIIAGCIGGAVFAAVVGFIAVRHVKRKREVVKRARENDAAYVLQVNDVQTMRDVDQLAAFRLPLDQVVVLDRLSTGDLWKGLFEGHVVSIRYLFTSTSTASEMQTGIQQVLAATRLDSRYLLSLHGVSWTTPKDLMVVQEYMDTGDLQTYLRNLNAQQITWRFKTKVVQHVVNALCYLHATANFVHGHVCAANVLLDGVKGAKLMMLDAQAPASSFRYMAPEVLRGDPFSAAADIFALGLLLSELDTHDVPYGHFWLDGDDDESVDFDGDEEDKRLMQRIKDGDATPVFTKACPPWVQSLAIRCLDADPAARPTAVQIQDELDHFRATEFA